MSKEFKQTTGLDFPQYLGSLLESGTLYKSDSPLDLLSRRSINFYVQNETFRDLGLVADRHYEDYSFLESVVSTSLNFFNFEAHLPILQHLQYSLFNASKTLFNDRFNSFSIIQINEFTFSPAKLRIYWQFETVFSLLIHLCKVSPACTTKAVFLYFEHFDLLFKFFEDVFLLLNFQKIKLFEVKKTEKPTKSTFGGFFKSVRSMLTQDVKVESENEIFIRQKHRGNITAKNKNSHLLRNFISTVATSFKSFKSLLDGLQFVLFGVANQSISKELTRVLSSDGQDFTSLLSTDLFGQAQWLKGTLFIKYFLEKVYVINVRNLFEGSQGTLSYFNIS